MTNKRYRITRMMPELPSLGRHVNHDPRSRRFRFTATKAALDPVFHARHVPIFDQGNLGSCTGNAALGILATGPYWDALSGSARQYGLQTAVGNRIPWTEEGAVGLYSAVTAADEFDGTYPPDDTGSDGLSAAKVLQSNGIIPGYQHAFGSVEALAALQHFPLLVGTEWTESMFRPDGRGRIAFRGPAIGGHEWIVDEYVPPLAAPHGSDVMFSHLHDYVGGTTSWGESFGAGGRFYILAADFARLLDAEGDVIVLTPPNSPAPEPAPVGDPDKALAAAIRTWLIDKGL